MHCKKYCFAVLFFLALAGCGGQIPGYKKFEGPQQGYSTDDLYRFFAVAFGAAPGVTYGLQLIEAGDAGMGLKEIVNVFTSKSQFTDAYPVSLSHREFASRLVSNVVGSSASEAAKQEAVDEIVRALGLPGWTRGDVIYAIFNNLAAKPASDVKWYGTAQRLASQVAYAKYFTEELLIDTDNLVQLRKPVSLADGSTDLFVMEQKILDALDIAEITPKKNDFVNLEIKDKARIGEDFSIKWNASRNFKCALAHQADPVYLTSGNIQIRSVVGGQKKYAFKCSNGTVRTNQIITLSTPLKTYSTSYENKLNYRFENSRIPILEEINGIKKEVGEYGTNLRSLAFADFLQNGTHTALIASTMYKGIEGNVNKQPDSPAKMYFIQKASDGSWRDISDLLFTSSDKRYTCASPGYIEIADFNNDGKPDAVMSCSGPDFMVNGIYPNPSTPQVTVLSRADGKYDISSLGTDLSSHQLAAADFDNDGNVDVISTDGYNHNTPVIFWGKGDGTFVFDNTRFPADMKWKSIFGIRAIPIDGSIKVLVSGNPRGTWPTPSDANFGTFELVYDGQKFVYVKDYSAEIPYVGSTGLRWGMAYDILYDAGFYYILRVNFDNSKNAIIKTNRSTGVSSMIYEMDRLNWSRADTSGVITFDKSGNIISQVAGCSRYSAMTTDYYHHTCYLTVKPQ